MGCLSVVSLRDNHNPSYLLWVESQYKIPDGLGGHKKALQPYFGARQQGEQGEQGAFELIVGKNMLIFVSFLDQFLEKIFIKQPLK